MPKNPSSKQKKKKQKEEQPEKIDYSYITEDEMRTGFKPSDIIQEGVVLCPFCSTSNTTADEVCFNCRRRLVPYEYLKKMKEEKTDEEA